MPIANKHIALEKVDRLIAIGVFDGVHLGHQQLIERASLVLTFNPHPLQVTTGSSETVGLLTTLEEKQHLIPFLLVLQFSDTIAGYKPDEFVRHILVEELQVEKVIVGYDFVFGRNREGTLPDLIRLGHEYGFTVEVVDRVTSDGVTIKSSLIRNLLRQGRVREANTYLGRDYFMFGQVIPGRGVGRTLGFPTANIMVPPEKLIPHLGVYSGNIIVEGSRYPCAINVGLRTAGISKQGTEIQETLIEAHILDFDQVLYGQRVELSFAEFVREERAFSSLEELRQQIARDVELVKMMNAR